MKIKVERINNIIKLPEEVAFLESVDSDGQNFIYKIRYLVNIVNAVKNKAINVKIKFLKDEQQQKKYNIFTTGKDANLVIDNLLNKKAKQKDLVRTKSDLILFQTKSDISKKIPNDKIKTIDTVVLKTVKNSIKKINASKGENVTRPVLAKNKAAFNDGLGINQKIFKEEMKKILLVHKSDPATFLGSKSRTIISTNNSFNGILNKKPKKNKKIPENNRKLDLVKENILSTTNPINTSELSNDEYVSVTEVGVNDYVIVDETVKIPIRLFTQPAFIIEFELFDNRGLSQQVISTKVNHKEKLDELLIPILPPSITSSPIHKPGKVVFSIKQNDKNCDKINLYKKILPLDQINIDSNFTFVKSITIDSSDGILSVFDNHASINPTLYRAIAVGKNGLLGAEFDTIIINQDKQKAKVKNVLSNKDTVLTLTHKINSNYIELFIENIPLEPIAIDIFKKDLTIKQIKPIRLGNRIFLENDKNEIITYQDTDVKKDRIYEYFCKLIYKNGDEAIAKNNLVIKFEKVESNITYISPITPVISEQNVDVEFFIEKNAISNNINIAKKILTEQNILTEYQDEITNEKERLQNLFFTRVLRTNKLNGEIEDFGIIDSETFSDKKYGPVKNVKPLEIGLEYIYTVMVYAIPAEILFEKYTRQVTVRSNVTYDLLPSKWLHPLTLDQGTITNKNVVKTRHANNIFTFGKVADIQYVNVNLNKILPVITNCKASIISEKKNLIKWKINGDAKKIDHFIILLELMGSRTIVGKSHNITSTNDFQFIDVLDNGEHGALKYIITPVYFDYSQGTEVFTNTIFI